MNANRYGRCALLLVTVLCVAPVFGAHPTVAKTARTTEQVDPLSGVRWIRVSDGAHPGAPPHLVLLPGEPSPTRQTENAAICVHSGDRLLLRNAAGSESSLTLEARALASAACGRRIAARIALTGAFVEVEVSAAGSGILLSRSEFSR